MEEEREEYHPKYEKNIPHSSELKKESFETEDTKEPTQASENFMKSCENIVKYLEEKLETNSGNPEELNPKNNVRNNSRKPSNLLQRRLNKTLSVKLP